MMRLRLSRATHAESPERSAVSRHRYLGSIVLFLFQPMLDPHVNVSRDTDRAMAAT
jgi:hypothetical protein